MPGSNQIRQIVTDRTWPVRVHNGRDPESKKRKYLNQTVHGDVRGAQSHLNKLSEGDRGQGLDSRSRH
jgi:hypothetical protein